jgi:hypothetical protein
MTNGAAPGIMPWTGIALWMATILIANAPRVFPSEKFQNQMLDS